MLFRAAAREKVLCGATALADAVRVTLGPKSNLLAHAIFAEGLRNIGVVVEKMRSSGGTIGFDAAASTHVDLVEAGIIDPTKVVRVALENAVSGASILLLTEATMAEAPEPQSKRHADAEEVEWGGD